MLGKQLSPPTNSVVEHLAEEVSTSNSSLLNYGVLHLPTAFEAMARTVSLPARSCNLNMRRQLIPLIAAEGQTRVKCLLV